MRLKVGTTHITICLWLYLSSTKGGHLRDCSRPTMHPNDRGDIGDAERFILSKQIALAPPRTSKCSNFHLACQLPAMYGWVLSIVEK
jgi:hypothetical protein